MAADSHAKTFPKSGDCTLLGCAGKHPCDKACIVAQLKNYYDDCGMFDTEYILRGHVLGTALF